MVQWGALPLFAPRQRRASFRRGIFFSARNSFEGNPLARANDYDLIVADYGLCGLYGLLLARRSKVPLLYSSHNVEYRSSLDKSKAICGASPWPPTCSPWSDFWRRYAAIVVATTDSDAARYRMWRPQKPVLVIPQGVDERVFNGASLLRIRLSASCLRQLFHSLQPGRDPSRGEADSSRASSAVAERDFRFLGAGARGKPLTPECAFWGFIDAYPAHLKAADVVISPMLRGQGFPTKIIEALACGKPTVATMIGARGIRRPVEILHVCGVVRFARGHRAPFGSRTVAWTRTDRRRLVALQLGCLAATAATGTRRGLECRRQTVCRSGMRVCLDLRYKIESGASSYIRNVVPGFVALGREMSWIGVKFAGQYFPFETAFDDMLVCPGRADVAHVSWTCDGLPFLLQKEGRSLPQPEDARAVL